MPFQPGDVSRDVMQLVAASEDFDGYRSLNDHSWLELSHEGVGSVTGYLARSASNGRLCGYAHISESDEGTAIEIVISPEQRSDYLEVASALVREAITDLPATAYPVSLWVTHSNELLEDVAHSIGMTASRELYQMRRTLPPEAGAPFETAPHALVLRSFKPGKDELSWLELNNRAFADHPDQGRWTLDTLTAREEEPWFDPRGFILCVGAGRLVGSCWTKIHSGNDRTDPPMGEIYVICTDPAYQGRGLAVRLLRAGLDYLSSRGLQIAMLYVDSGNAPALKLYAGFGFEIHHIDRAFTLREPPGRSRQPGPIRVHTVIEGRVQGVFFRQSCLEMAVSYGLGGWVRNTPDGNVEAAFEGNSAAVHRAIEWCHQGPPRALVDRVTTYPENVIGEGTFRII